MGIKFCCFSSVEKVFFLSCCLSVISAFFYLFSYPHFSFFIFHCILFLLLLLCLSLKFLYWWIYFITFTLCYFIVCLCLDWPCVLSILGMLMSLKIRRNRHLLYIWHTVFGNFNFIFSYLGKKNDHPNHPDHVPSIFQNSLKKQEKTTPLSTKIDPYEKALKRKKNNHPDR